MTSKKQTSEIFVIVGSNHNDDIVKSYADPEAATFHIKTCFENVHVNLTLCLSSVQSLSHA